MNVPTRHILALIAFGVALIGLILLPVGSKPPERINQGAVAAIAPHG